MAREFAKTHKEWERPLIQLEDTIDKLRSTAQRESDPVRRADIENKVRLYQEQCDRYLRLMYANLGAWEKVLVARAESRPYALDYIGTIFSDFVELDGDRRGNVDHAIVGGPARLSGRAVMVVGHQKGRNIQERQFRNFGMTKPEGYRKAVRLFQMADRFRMPIVTLVDTPAADPGVESESRGISEAIADAMFRMFELTVPVVSVIIGEGGSGGAIGIAVANRVYMQEHAIYSVIPPEGCAAILWRAPERGPDAAAALRLTAQSALEFELIDEIIDEPEGAAHRDPIAAAAAVRATVEGGLALLDGLSPSALREQRQAKFRRMGIFGG